MVLAILRQLQTIYIEARPIMRELAGVPNPTQGHMKRLRNKVPHSTVMLGEFFSADAPLERILDWACDAALAAGGTDNVTAVAARWLGRASAPENGV